MRIYEGRTKIGRFLTYTFHLLVYFGTDPQLGHQAQRRGCDAHVSVDPDPHC